MEKEDLQEFLSTLPHAQAIIASSFFRHWGPTTAGAQGARQDLAPQNGEDAE